MRSENTFNLISKLAIVELNGVPIFRNSPSVSDTKQAKKIWSRHKYLLTTTMTAIILGFDQTKQEYPTYKDFGTAYIDLPNGNQGKHP